MTSDKIVPPFKVAECNDGHLTKYILDRDGNDVVRVSRYLPCAMRMASELCTIMNENHDRLCHAANGEVNRAPMDDLVLHVGTDGVPFSREIKNHYENTKEDK